MRRTTTSLLFGSILSAALPAQCELQWQPGSGTVGLDGEVYATCRWDPDGPGPAGELYVLAGRFQVAGNVAANRLASFDPATSTWAELGGGLGGTIECLLPLPSGALLVGGQNLYGSSSSLGSLGQWDGTDWQSVGQGLGGRIYSLTRMPNGDLVACGDFSSYPSNLRGIAAWNGTSWSSLGTPPIGAVFCSTLLPSGDLLVGGKFSQIGGQAIEALARWDGVAWHAIPGYSPISSYSEVQCILPLPGGDLFVADYYRELIVSNSGTTTLIGANGKVEEAVLLPGGQILVGGSLSLMSSPFVSEGLLLWDGSSWQAIGAALDGWVNSLTALPSGDMLVGGSFKFDNHSRRLGYATRWDGATHHRLYDGTIGSVRTVAAAPSGAFEVAGGDFVQLEGVACNHVARHDGSGWTPLGTGTAGPVHEAIVLTDDSIVVAGSFQQAGGSLARRVARWNGSAWHPLGSGCNYAVNALAETANGDLIATGEFTLAGGVPCSRIARWNGATWAPLGAGIDLRGLAVTTRANGDLVVGGEFTLAGGNPAQNIASWDGAMWNDLGGGVPFVVTAVVERASGELVAGGYDGGGAAIVATWDGSAWSTMPFPTDHAIAAFALLPTPGREVITVGSFHSNNQVLGFADRWIGNAPGYSIDGVFDGPVADVAVTASGEILCGGDFVFAGGQLSRSIARITPPCPATQTAFGLGCAGSLGPVIARATTLPWLGGSCRAVAENVPAGALAAALVGLDRRSIPLSTLHPLAGSACRVYATADIIALVAPTNGQATWTFQVPNDPTLVGLELHEQFVVGELGASSHLQSLVSSNGLTLSLGSL